MTKRLVAPAGLLTVSLASCDPVSLSTLNYTPKNLSVEEVRKPLDKAAEQFGLEPRAEVNPGRLVYHDAPGAARPHLGVTAETLDGKIVIGEMFTFSPSPRMLAYEQALISNFATAGVSASSQTPAEN